MRAGTMAACLLMSTMEASRRRWLQGRNNLAQRMRDKYVSLMAPNFNDNRHRCIGYGFGTLGLDSGLSLCFLLFALGQFFGFILLSFRSSQSYRVFFLYSITPHTS